MQENAFNYDKGVLAEILEPIMGKGLIPADLETWKPRRRAIVPAFHKAYLDAMVHMFGRCTQETIRSLDALTEGDAQVPAGYVCLKSSAFYFDLSEEDPCLSCAALPDCRNDTLRQVSCLCRQGWLCCQISDCSWCRRRQTWKKSS